MTADEAKGYLDGRMRQRFDGWKGNWTVTDAHAVSALLRYVGRIEGELEGATRSVEILTRSRSRWMAKAKGAYRRAAA